MKRWVIRGTLGGGALLLLFVLVFLAVSAVPVPDPPAPLAAQGPVAIEGVAVVDVVEGRVLAARTVVIAEGRIRRVGPAAEVEIPPGATRIDGTGAYVIPGLWDMHAHHGTAWSPLLTMPLFVANGVTGIRDMGGDAGAAVRADWGARVEAGSLLGPRIVGHAARSFFRVRTAAEGRAAVDGMRSSSEGGFVKVFNQVYPDAFAAMLEAAGEAGVDVVGHRPRAVAAIDASAAGMRSFEHARLFLFECFDGADDLRRSYLAQFNGEGDGGRLDDTAGLQAMLDGHDPAMCDALIDTMVANGTWFCPTHVTRRMDALAGDADFRGDPRLAYIRRLQRFEWNWDADEMLERYPGAEGHATVTAFYEKGLELTGKAHRAGVKILAGADAGDTYCFPGFSLHDELKELVKAGLSPLDALRAATLNGAEYARATADHGSVTPGKIADLVLIEGNPLDDIANTSRIRAVIFDGVVYDRPTLDAMLDDVKGHASSLPLAAREIRSNMSP